MISYAVSASDASSSGSGKAGDDYGEGMMVVHISDGTSGQLMWRGGIQAKLVMDGNVSERVRRVRSMHIVRELLSHFFPSRIIG